MHEPERIRLLTHDRENQTAFNSRRLHHPPLGIVLCSDKFPSSRAASGPVMLNKSLYQAALRQAARESEAGKSSFVFDIVRIE
jgi:hypothetical protein